MILLENRWYVTHTGLVRLARRKRCRGIHVEAVDSLCDSAANRFVLKATVYPSKDSAGFVGYGDADPSNVSLLVRGAEMRIAETRAVNRALRKAYGIGICSVEEIGSNPGPMAAPDSQKSPPNGTNGNGNGSGHKVRDRLCQIIRQHKLDPELVKAYAVDFCGTKALKDATREQVEELRPAAGRCGQEGPRCPALPAQQLRTPKPGGGGMKRHVPGLSETARDSRPEVPDGIFLVRLDHAQHRWQAQKRFYVLRLSILEPKPFAGRSIVSRLYCTPKAMWKLGWFLRDFLYDPELLSQDEIDEQALRGLVGVVKISHTVVNGISLVNFDGFAPASQWEELVPDMPIPPAGNGKGIAEGKGIAMTYSYTQISQYLTCPRRYRHRYLDGWQEKDVRAAMLFGRCFEQAVAALFRHEDPAAVLFEQWAPCKNLELVYSGNDTWDHMLQQGIQLLERFVQDGRVRDSPATEPSADSVHPDAEFRQQLCCLRRCRRRTGRHTLCAGVEDQLRPLSRGAGRHCGPGSAAGLLFLDDRDQ